MLGCGGGTRALRVAWRRRADQPSRVRVRSGERRWTIGGGVPQVSAPTVVSQSPISTVSSVSGGGRGASRGKGLCAESRLTLGSVAGRERPARCPTPVTVASWSEASVPIATPSPREGSVRGSRALAHAARGRADRTRHSTFTKTPCGHAHSHLPWPAKLVSRVYAPGSHPSARPQLRHPMCEISLGRKIYSSRQGPKWPLFRYPVGKASSRQPPTGRAGSPKGNPTPPTMASGPDEH